MYDKHGTLRGYQNGCRCDECRRAHNEYMRDWWRRNKERLHLKVNARVRLHRLNKTASHETHLRNGRRANARARDWYASVRNGPCVDCGNRFPPECMDFDHRPGEIKLFDLSHGMRRARGTALAEIAKCDLVCSNCHRIRTAARKRQKLLPREGFRPHGRAGWIDPQSKKSEQSRHDERTGAAG